VRWGTLERAAHGLDRSVEVLDLRATKTVQLSAAPMRLFAARKPVIAAPEFIA